MLQRKHDIKLLIILVFKIRKERIFGPYLLLLISYYWKK